jgi:hypothetical protein
LYNPSVLLPPNYHARRINYKNSILTEARIVGKDPTRGRLPSDSIYSIRCLTVFSSFRPQKSVASVAIKMHSTSRKREASTATRNIIGSRWMCLPRKNECTFWWLLLRLCVYRESSPLTVSLAPNTWTTNKKALTDRPRASIWTSPLLVFVTRCRSVRPGHQSIELPTHLPDVTG